MKAVAMGGTVGERSAYTVFAGKRFGQRPLGMELIKNISNCNGVLCNVEL
jgi:hypothetical protein